MSLPSDQATPTIERWWREDEIPATTVCRIYRRYILACILVSCIGGFTFTYQDHILNAEVVGGGLMTAGIIGILHCLRIIKNVRIASYAMELAIGYRIGTFVLMVIRGPYETPEVVNVFVWLLLLFSAISNRKYMIGAQRLQSRAKGISHEKE